jgi:hypothetical protein
VFVGIKNFRDKSLGGFITFKQAFLNGMAIVCVASVIYVIGWMVYMPNFAPDFPDKYAETQVSKIYANPELTDEQKAEKSKEVYVMMDNYKKPHVMAAYTFIEIFPVGLVVTLFISLLVKRGKRSS